MTLLPSGTVMVCPECGRTLYRLTADKQAGDRIEANEIVRVDGDYDPETMQRLMLPVTCPVDGVVPAHKLALRTPDGEYAFGSARERG